MNTVAFEHHSFLEWYHNDW